MLERHAASLVRKLPATSTYEFIPPITKKMCTAYVRKTGLRVPGGNAADTVNALHDTCANVRYERLYRQSMRARHAALMEKENTSLHIRIIDRLYRPYLPRIAELLAPLVRFYSSYPWLSLQRGECAVSYAPSRRVGVRLHPAARCAGAAYGLARGTPPGSDGSARDDRVQLDAVSGAPANPHLPGRARRVAVVVLVPHVRQANAERPPKSRSWA